MKICENAQNGVRINFDFISFRAFVKIQNTEARSLMINKFMYVYIKLFTKVFEHL